MLTQPSFGRRLRQLRQQRGMKQTDLIGPGMSGPYLSRLESGARPPTERAIAYLAERLDVPVGAFYVREPTDLVDVLATVLVAADGDARSERLRLQQALQHASPADPALRWQAYVQLAKLLGVENDREGELEALAALNALSDELGHPALQLHSRLLLARSLRGAGQMERARSAAKEGLSVAGEASLTGHDAKRCQLLLASVTAELGDLAEASRLSTEVCRELAHDSGALVAEAFWTAATIATRQGHHARSADLLAQALEALDSQEDLTLWMRLRLAASALALKALPPDLDRAERCLTQAKPALDLIGSAQQVREYAFLQAQLAYAHGDIDTANRLTRQVEEREADLTFRDRVRLLMLREQICIKQSDPEANLRLQHLAAEVHSQGMLDLAAEVWRAAAEAQATHT